MSETSFVDRPSYGRIIRIASRRVAQPAADGRARSPGAAVDLSSHTFDLIPDFIPVLGYADDAVIVTAVLRSVVRRTGIAAVRIHWPGSDDGFTALCRLTGLNPQPIAPIRLPGNPHYKMPTTVETPMSHADSPSTADGHH